MLTFISPGNPKRVNLALIEEPLRRIVIAAQEGKPLVPIMTEVVQSFGFDSFLYAMTTVSQPDRDSRAYCWTNQPKEWILAYEANAYVEVDPRITATFNRTSPFVWDSATVGGDSRVKKFLGHAARFGICSGVVCAFCYPSRARMGFMFNSSMTPVLPERAAQIRGQLGMLMLFSANFHEILMATHIAKGLPPMSKGLPLSPRERQCLSMASKGLTSNDIGLKLGIAERTVNFHFSNLLGKLDVLNRQEAIGKALSLGLINAPY
jgi:DNA-binding CsgD family transcriptional regulator